MHQLIMQSVHFIAIAWFFTIFCVVQVNDLRSRGKQLSATEHIFITATMQFRENIKSMYSLSVSACRLGNLTDDTKTTVNLSLNY